MFGQEDDDRANYGHFLNELIIYLRERERETERARERERDRASERERERERETERARERERPSERPRKVARACEPASAHLSLQAMRLSYFKNSDFAASLQINIML